MTFQSQIRKYATNTYMLQTGKPIFYDDFARDVAGRYARLRPDIQPGKIVLLKDIPPSGFAPWLFAIWSMGAIAFPLSSRLPQSVVAAIAEEVRPIALIAPRAEDLPVPWINAAGGREPSREAIPDFDWVSEKPATLIMTSGSTGRPKYAIHSLKNHYYSARGVNGYFNLRAGESWLLDLPLFHVGGLAILARCFLAGATVQIKTDDLASEIINNPPDYISLVAAQFTKLCEDERSLTALNTCKAVFLGGSAISAGMVQQALTRGIKLFTGYSLTEMSSTVAIRSEQRKTSVILPHRELKIKEGEIWLKGQCLFAGYWQKGCLHRTTDVDGWFPSSDLGLIDKSGLRVTGRMDNMFISGGENIQPEEVERVLRALPQVLDALVFPLSDVYFGQRPGCFIKPAAGPLPSKAFFQKALSHHLPKFKIPIRFFAWSAKWEDPRQKISRPELPGMSATALEID